MKHSVLFVNFNFAKSIGCTKPFISGLFILITFYASGQNNTYKNFTINEGLPSSEIYQIIKDRNGFIWLATDNGVVRYDGVEFEQYNLKDGLIDPVVFGIHEDSIGRLWFRTYTGKLCYYESNRIYRYPYNNIIEKYTAKGIVSDIVFDNNGTLWLSIGKYFLKIDPNGNPNIEQVPTYTIELRQIQNHSLWAYSGPTQRINKLVTPKFKEELKLSDSSKIVGRISNVSWNNLQYVSINRDLFQITDKVNLVYKAPSPIISLTIDTDNKLWIGCLNNGIIYTDDAEFKTLSTIEELQDKSITGVLQDTESGHWFSSLEKGLYYFPNLSIKRYPLPTSSKITSIKSLQNNIIVFDMLGKAIALSTLSSKESWRKDFQYPVISSYKTVDGNLWISTNRETLILDMSGAIIRNDLPANITAFTELEGLIIGINTKGFYGFDKNGEIKIKKTIDAQYRSILYDNENTIFAAGKNGFYKFDKNFENKFEIKEFSDVKITNIQSLNDSLLILSSIGNGFILFNKHTQSSVFYNKASRFIANNIYSIIMVSSQLCIGTEKGISICKIDSLISGSPKFKQLTARNGLVNDKVNYLLSNQNYLFAFSEDGYTQYPIDLLNRFENKPIGYLKEFQVNERRMEFKSGILLKHNENNIQIKIGFQSFNNQPIITRFRFEKDEAWNYPNSWLYSFNSLSPGIYNLEIQFSTDNLNWNKTNLNLEFTITPPWWNTWYFRGFIMVVLVLVGYLLFRYRLARLREKNQYLNLINQQQQKLLFAEIDATERERSRIAKDLHDGISIDLMAIKLINQQNKSHTAKQVEEQLDKTSIEIKNIIYGLSPPGLERFGLSVGLRHYIDRLPLQTKTPVFFEYEGEECTKIQLNLIMFRIIQELISNSLTHAACQNITLKIKSDSNQLTISYYDDGKGFDLNTIKHGFGIYNIHSRVESLHGKIIVESNKLGTSYEISVPVNQQMD